MITGRLALVAFLSTVSVLAAAPAAAQARREAAAPAAPAGAAGVMPQTADVSGFRSAKFGMSENDVKNDIASAMAPKLAGLGFVLSQTQLYWLAAMPGLAGGTLRLVWMFLPPIMGSRNRRPSSPEAG